MSESVHSLMTIATLQKCSCRQQSPAVKKRQQENKCS